MRNSESENQNISRRRALALIGGGVASLSGCLSSTEPTPAGDGRLTSRPRTPTGQPTTGVIALPFSLGVVGLAYVPPSYDPSKPAPLALLLHGAGQGADELMTPVSRVADERGLVLLAISSTDSTWDLVRAHWGSDLQAIDRALAWLFDRVVVDTSRVGVIGFSDGASYSLALGRVNGDLFRRVVAYAPGILFDVPGTGKPEFFVTHGTNDQVLAFATTRDRIVPGLRGAGYAVEFREFSGGHGVTQALMAESLDWLVRKA